MAGEISIAGLQQKMGSVRNDLGERVATIAFLRAELADTKSKLREERLARRMRRKTASAICSYL